MYDNNDNNGCNSVTNEGSRGMKNETKDEVATEDVDNEEPSARGDLDDSDSKEEIDDGANNAVLHEDTGSKSNSSSELLDNHENHDDIEANKPELSDTVQLENDSFEEQNIVDNTNNEDVNELVDKDIGNNDDDGVDDEDKDHEKTAVIKQDRCDNTFHNEANNFEAHNNVDNYDEGDNDDVVVGDNLEEEEEWEWEDGDDYEYEFYEVDEDEYKVQTFDGSFSIAI